MSRPEVARNRRSLAVALGVAVVLFLQLVAFRVRETERAVVKTFGRASRELREPGLYWKWPWPIEEVVLQDARLHVLEGPLEETVTEDKKSVLVGCVVTWRPENALRFLERLETTEAAERALERLLRQHQNSALGRFPFAALVTQDPAQFSWDAVEAAIREPLVATARDELGIEVATVAIRRLALPKDTTDSVFTRMKREREEKAATYLADGQARSEQIKATAERERDVALDAARAEAKRLVADADLACEAHYRVLEKDPALAIYLRKLEALKRALSGRTTVVYDMGSWPFDVLAPEGSIAPVTSKAKVP